MSAWRVDTPDRSRECGSEAEARALEVALRVAGAKFVCVWRPEAVDGAEAARNGPVSDAGPIGGVVGHLETWRGRRGRKGA